jgi:CBS domain-containing protein
MTIAAIMRGPDADIFSAACNESVADVTTRLAEQRIGALPVIEGGVVVGIFSERDIIYGLAKHGPDMMQKSIRDVMTAPAITITSDTPILSALSLMTRRRIRHLPVVDAGTLVGFVSIGDLVKHRIERIEAEASAMRDYIQMA